MRNVSYAIVIPTVGRPRLRELLGALVAGSGPPPTEILVVDDRPETRRPLLVPAEVRVLRTGGRGPAAARNAGWRATRARWIAFLDDDVLPPPDWRDRLVADLADLPQDVGGSQGRVEVPLPTHRRPTDAERNTAGLAGASWITADMAYRRAVLIETGGFDERFGRAYREDSDLALRVRDLGLRLVRGNRQVTHPVRPTGWWASVRAQAGNADDALMRHRHGRDWRVRAQAPPGRLRRHVVTTAAAVTALARPRLAVPVWGALTAWFAAERIAPGPRTAAEVTGMLVTSAAIPPVAVAQRLRGEVRARLRRVRPPAAVLFDRDGTLIADVPYNADPDQVVPVPQARAALDRLRRLGVPIGVVTNQSGVGRGMVSATMLAQVNRRVEELLGPFDAWEVCPHDPAAACECRKPAPGLIEQAAASLGVGPASCVVIGDIGSDVAAARAAGARGILVPTERTRQEEVDDAPEVAASLTEAVYRAIGAVS